MADIANDEMACTKNKADAIVRFSETYLKSQKSDQATDAASEEVDSEEELAEVDQDQSEGTYQSVLEETSEQEGSTPGLKLPEPLIQFALAYGLKVSAICK
jgi:hypothetical protein